MRYYSSVIKILVAMSGQPVQWSDEAMEDLDDNVTGASFSVQAQRLIDNAKKNKKEIVPEPSETESTGEQSASLKKDWKEYMQKSTVANVASKQIADHQLKGTVIVSKVEALESLVDAQDKHIATMSATIHRLEKQLADAIGSLNASRDRVNQLTQRVDEIDQAALEVMDQAARIVSDAKSEDLNPSGFRKSLNEQIDKAQASVKKNAGSKPLKAIKPIATKTKKPKMSFA